jgi:hypothetical protein
MTEEVFGARQGDVYLLKLTAELSPIIPFSLSPDAAQIASGEIVLAHGEATGHMHRVLAQAFNPPQFRDTAESGGEASFAKPRLFRDPDLERRLRIRGIGTGASNLLIGILKVEEGTSAQLVHDEHDPITLDPGLYYVGRQREISPEEARAPRRVED